LRPKITAIPDKNAKRRNEKSLNKRGHPARNNTSGYSRSQMRSCRKKKVIAVVSVIIVIMIVAGILAPVIMANAQTAESSLDSQYAQLQKQQKELEQQQKDLKSKIKGNKSDQAAVEKQIDNIAANMSAIKQQIDILGNQISECGKKIETKNAGITATQKRIDENTELYKQRMCSLYEAGNVSRLQVLLSSKSITEFLTRYEIIKMIEEHDNNLITRLKADKQSIESEKKSLESQKEDLLAKQTKLDEQKSTYEAQDAESKALYKQLKNSSSKLEKESEAIDAAEEAANAKLEKIIKQKAEEARKAAEAGGGSYDFVGGTWLWPIQSMSGQYISSYFGPRSGHTYPHTGIDIAAGGISGHQILAANSGDVIIAGYDSSGIYGNYVVIDHGGGMTSLYGHCSGLNCSVGDEVSRGDVIAYVGNTGKVTSLGGGGYHLHFQIMKDGTPVNPLNYVKMP
jgi:murein DD-endopeptidase MepM/ murein hydrolase activator NlpD